MTISILTLFPEMFVGPFDFSIVKKAQERGIVTIDIINIRNFGIGRHQVVDDTPYGGGFGMVLRVDVVHKAIEHTKKKYKKLQKPKVVLLGAHGKTFNQQKAKKFAELDHLILVCGHYEGIDERIKNYIDEEVSIGDFILTGGELPAMLITDTVVRLVKAVLKEGVTEKESYSLTSMDNTILLEHPHYTRPKVYKGQTVPEVLLSGDHKKIDAWREKQAIEVTKVLRPDLQKS
jgi:tRNA (guanine37-N1)-methyltransferase